MSRIQRVRRLSVLTGLSEHCWPAPPPRAVRHLGHRLAAQARRARLPQPHRPITALARRNK